MRKPKVLLTAAPGGHSGYAYAIAYYLRKLGIQVAFLTARGDPWTKEKLKQLGRIIEIEMPRKPNEPLYKTIHRWPRAAIDALKTVTEEYDILVACGSNHSIMPALVAKTRGLKLVNLESIVRFTVPGRTPKLLYPIADLTIVHWKEQLKHYPKAFVAGPIYEPPKYKPKDEGYILVTAGTQGHKQLFDTISKLNLKNVVMQTGKVDPKPYQQKHPSWIVFRYDPDLEKWIAGASIVITHFPGMTSATAALAYQKPVILVPAPHLKYSAPLADGRIYAKKVGAILLLNNLQRTLLRIITYLRGLQKRRRLGYMHNLNKNGSLKTALLIYNLTKY